MIRSFLKKVLGSDAGGAPSPKPYPFKYDAAKAKPTPPPKKPEPVVEAKAPEPEPEPEPAIEPEPAAEAAPAEDEVIELLSVAELRKRLIARGVKPRSKARKPELLDMLAELDGGGASDEEAPAPAAPAVEGGLDPVEVQELLDDMVRPALQADGGDIQLVEVQGMDVHVRLVGACTTCPSSIMTMKMGVEALFKEEFPGFGELVQVN